LRGSGERFLPAAAIEDASLAEGEAWAATAGPALGLADVRSLARDALTTFDTPGTRASSAQRGLSQ
jgi:hypothetical protein